MSLLLATIGCLARLGEALADPHQITSTRIALAMVQLARERIDRLAGELEREVPPWGEGGTRG